VAEGNEKYAIDFTVLSKVIVTFGVLWLISYLAVRWLVILNGGGGICTEYGFSYRIG